MPEARFSRIYNNTSWDELLINTKIQKNQKCKPLCYEVFAEISLSLFDFDALIKLPSKPHPCYLPYAFQSVANENGIWQCILISNKIDNRKIVLYTAGRTFPLYAAIIT